MPTAPFPARAAGGPIRVALLVDSMDLPLWCYEVVRDIQASDVARVTLIVRNAGTAGGEHRAQRGPLGKLRTAWRSRDQLIYLLFDRYDAWRFRSDADPFPARSIAPLVRECATLDVTPRMTKFCDYFSDADVAEIRRHDVDVAVRFGFRIVKGKALEIARYGVWSYHHGDNLVNRGGPPGFWEVMEAHATTGSILQILTEELDAGQVIYRSHASTDRRSVARNRSNYYWKSGKFLLRKLRDLYCEGPGALTDRSVRPDLWPVYGNRLYTIPRNGEMLRLLLRQFGRYALAKVRATLWSEQWFLALTMRKGVCPGSAVPETALYRARPIYPPRDRIWADPCPVQHGDRYYIFFEEMLHECDKGHISVMEVDAEGNWGAPVKVLEQDYHLSYPFVFEWNGTYYLVPESYQNRTVELYRAVEFPWRWEFDRVLLSGLKGVDATLAEIGGRWWMFVNVAPAEHASVCDEMHLYYADTPLGPWHAHRRNPVKSDVRSARSAGRVFQWRGHYYRPAQDCSRSYGHSISINRICHIDPEEYAEEEISRVEPKWMPNLTGTHTLSAAGGLTVVDGRRRIRRFF